MSNYRSNQLGPRDISIIIGTARTAAAWSDAEVSLLRQLAGDHLSASEIASLMSRSSRAIGNKAFSLGIRYGRPRKQRKAWGKDDDANLVDLARARITRRAAAHLMSRKVGTLRNHLQSLGISWRDPPRKSPREQPAPRVVRRDPRILADQLRWLADNGWSVGMAALELDIDASRAWRVSRDFGIDWKVHFRSVRGASPGHESQEPAPHHPA
jgi:hypothetical protein